MRYKNEIETPIIIPFIIMFAGLFEILWAREISTFIFAWAFYFFGSIVFSHNLYCILLRRDE